MEFGAIDVTEANPALVARGVAALAGSEDTVGTSGTDLAEFLRVHSSHAPKDAARVGCEQLGITCELCPGPYPFALDKGRPLVLISLASIATAGFQCEVVAQRLEGVDACTACDSRACTPKFLDGAVAQTLRTPVPQPRNYETPENRDMAAVLAVAASGMEVACP